MNICLSQRMITIMTAKSEFLYAFLACCEVPMLRSKDSPPWSVTSRHSSNTNKPTDLPHVEVLQNSFEVKCSNGYRMPTANHYW